MTDEALEKAWTVIKAGDSKGYPCKKCGATKGIEKCGGGVTQNGRPVMAAQCPFAIGFGEAFFGGPLSDPEYP